MIKICPNCRSTFKLLDTVDITAPATQVVKCPVCDQEIWVHSGWVLPKRWEVGEIVKRWPAEGAPPEAQVFEQTVPKSAQTPYWNIKFPDFGSMASIGGNVGSGIKTGATIGVVVLILLLAFRYGPKGGK